MLGRLLELSLVVTDTGLAWQRWLDLGFAAAETGDVWPHRYGVVTSGDLAIGFHAAGDEPVCVSFVRPEVAELERTLADRLIGIERAKLDPDTFNYLELREPGGLLLRVQEARTFSAPAEDAESTALGRWTALSLPSPDLAEARGFWERLDYEVQDRDQPWESIAIQGLPLACHDAALVNAPVLLFTAHRDAGATSATEAGVAAGAGGIAQSGASLAGLAPGRPVPALRDRPHQLLRAAEGIHLLRLD